MGAGFNNLSKALSFNLHDFAVGRNEAERESYVRYINETFNASKLTPILIEIANIIEAKVLNVSQHDFTPEGASSMVLMSDSVNVHLDTSHICAHTYLDVGDPNGIITFRVDIDISTCGTIVPLKALDHMIRSLRWNDVIVIDYVVRGFTRENGRRVFMDHDIDRISKFIDPGILRDFHIEEFSFPTTRTWQTKLLRMELNPRDYFAPHVDPHSEASAKALQALRKEMRAVFHTSSK